MTHGAGGWNTASGNWKLQPRLWRSRPSTSRVFGPAVAKEGSSLDTKSSRGCDCSPGGISPALRGPWCGPSVWTLANSKGSRVDRALKATLLTHVSPRHGTQNPWGQVPPGKSWGWAFQVLLWVSGEMVEKKSLHTCVSLWSEARRIPPLSLSAESQLA